MTIAKKKWLMILGVRTGYAVPSHAKKFLAQADVLLGNEKNIAAIIDEVPQKITRQILFRPFDKNITWLKKMANQDKKVVFAVTGDPNFFGASKIIIKHFDLEGIEIVPAISVVSQVAGKMGWAVEDVITLSTHGDETTRPIQQIVNHLHHQAKIIIIGRDGAQINSLAQLLCDKGFGKSNITIFSNLGDEQEKTTKQTAEQIIKSESRQENFYTLAISLVASQHNAGTMTTAGHANNFFIHDGQITKPETRAIILAKLQPAPHKILWDIGGGSGSVAIEWALRGGRAITIEEKKSRYDNIKKNILQFGLGNNVVAYHNLAEKIITKLIKKNPAMMNDEDWASYPPDVIFVGGGVSNEKLMASLWQILPSGKKILSASYSLEGFAAQLQQQKKWGGDIMTVVIDEALPIGDSKKFHALTTSQKTTLHLITKNT